MEEQSSFGALLKRYRQAATLSQEDLAERAGLTAQAISTLERGLRRSPQWATVRLLANALNLTEPQRAAFEAAARQPDPQGVAALGSLPAELTPLIGRAPAWPKRKAFFCARMCACSR